MKTRYVVIYQTGTGSVPSSNPRPYRWATTRNCRVWYHPLFYQTLLATIGGYCWLQSYFCSAEANSNLSPWIHRAQWAMTQYSIRCLAACKAKHKKKTWSSSSTRPIEEKKEEINEKTGISIKCEYKIPLRKVRVWQVNANLPSLTEAEVKLTKQLV